MSRTALKKPKHPPKPSKKCRECGKVVRGHTYICPCCGALDMEEVA